jgi:argininosuccinate lyase
MLEGVTFDRERLATGAEDDFLAATEIADLLVRRGVPFREAHGIVGGLVRHAHESGKSLAELDTAELGSFSEKLDDEYYDLLSSRSWIESKVSEGGTASVSVAEQLAAARKTLRGIGTVTREHGR